MRVRSFDVRIRLARHASTELLRSLRRLFPELAEMPVADLRAHLATTPVVRGLSHGQILERRAELAPFGVTLEIVPDPPSPVSVRITLARPPTTAQLRALRARFEALAQLPPSSLRDHLTRWPRCVVGALLQDELDATRRDLEPLGVTIEPVGEYGADTLRAVLPGAPQPDWDAAEAALEVVVLPSFHPEVVLRAWAGKGRSWTQLASLGTQLWRTRYNQPPWLVGDDEDVPPEDPSSEVAELADDVAALVDAALALPPTRPRIGLDGVIVALRARRGDRVHDVETWSPTPSCHPELVRLLVALRLGARRALSHPASVARLTDLDGYGW